MRTHERLLRNAGAVVLVTGLVLGTVWWQTDDTWPFAQMRMFPGGGESAIAITRIRAELADGRRKDMNPFAFHLKRADIEGQMDRIRANPAMLQDLIDAYNRTVPGRRRILAISLVRVETPSGGGEPTQRLIVRWPER